MRTPIYIIALWLAALAAAGLLGCANPGSGPDGGPYDEKPPRIVSVTQPDELQRHYRPGGKTRITLTFDERVNIKDAQDKVIVSPPQHEPPEISAAGRRVNVTLFDTIRPGLTYTIDFSDAIEDVTEGNPLGNYTYIFSTGTETDTMQVGGYVLDAENLEPLKGILVGLYARKDSVRDSTALRQRSLERVARTDGRGFFSIKGVAAGSKYDIYALQDMDQDFKFSQQAEQIAFGRETLTPDAFADVRYDTLWVDTVRWDDVRVVPYTHFTPDDVVLLAFREAQQPRYFLKSQREEPESFTTYFTAPSAVAPTIEGINFDARNAFVENRNASLDTITYWLRDTTLLRQDTLAIGYTYEMWDDSLGTTRLQTDTLELVPRLTFDRRAKNREADLQKWEKAREKRHRRGDYSQEIPPTQRLDIKMTSPPTFAPDRNLRIAFSEPLARVDTSRIHLMLKIDSLFTEVPWLMDSVAHDILARQFRADWRPGQDYRIVFDTIAVESIYGRDTDDKTFEFHITKEEEVGTLFVTIPDATPQTVVQLINGQENVAYEVPMRDGRAEFYYLKPDKYFIRCFDDRNGDGKWTPGQYNGLIAPEDVYYCPEEVVVKAAWDHDKTWRIGDKPRYRQKPSTLLKTKESANRKASAHERNIQRLRDRGKGQNANP